MNYLVLLAVCMFGTHTSAYYTFRSRIPNAEIVPHPCKANYLWGGVGHENPDGGGSRNVFGTDFKNAGYRWTQDLCRYDSDGDGKTNGEELGDPDCEWTEGSVPKIVTGITHPGICDPFGQGVCAGRDSFVDCNIETLENTCDVIKNADIQTAEFRLKQLEVPNTETNHYCQYFDVPVTGNYHIVADEGIIDNHDVVHHQLLFGCPDDYQGSPTDDTPTPCAMNEGGNSCNQILAAWTVGYKGNCFGSNMGFRIGNKGFKKFKLEIHYNNPLLVQGYTDNSGMRIYFQPEKPGVQDLATFTVGQTALDIPPGQSGIQFQGTCEGSCTQQIFTKPIYIVSALSHMHYLGRAQKTEVLRNGQVIKVLADDTPYDYDSPIIHKQETPFEVLPGDEIRTTCVYSSMSSQKWVSYGDATSDEMCFAFLNVYPEDALQAKWCVSEGPLGTCDSFNKVPKYGCDWNKFIDISQPEMLELYKNVEQNCRLDGVCRPECKEIVDDILKHPCMGKEMNDIVSKYLGTYHEGAKFLGKIRSCTGHAADVDCKKDCAHACNGGHDGDGDWDGPADRATSLPVLPLAAMLIMAFLLQKLV